jgi:hypothetical protein
VSCIRYCGSYVSCICRDPSPIIPYPSCHFESHPAAGQRLSFAWVFLIFLECAWHPKERVDDRGLRLSEESSSRPDWFGVETDEEDDTSVIDMADEYYKN